jgi:hypothetical protein
MTLVMRSSVDNPLWEDAAVAQPGSSARVPLSPLEAALQALPVNRPRSSIRTHPSKACNRSGAASSGTTADNKSCCAGNVPLSFEAWRPSSSEVRRALKTQPAANSGSISSPGPKGGRAPSMGAAQGRKSASLSPVCWSLSSDCGDENGVQLHSDWMDGSVWRADMRHAAPVNGSAEVCDRQHQQQQEQRQQQHWQQPACPTESPEAPASPQPLESPLKRLRLSDDLPLQCASPSAEAAGGDSLAEAAAGRDSDLPATAGMQRHGSPRGSRAGSIAGGAPVDAAKFAMQEAPGACTPSAARGQAPVVGDDASGGAAAAAAAFAEIAGRSSDSEPESPCSTSAAGLLGLNSCCGTPTAVRHVVVTIDGPSGVVNSEYSI